MTEGERITAANMVVAEIACHSLLSPAHFRNELKGFLPVLLAHIYVFNRYSSRDGGQPWLAVSSTYHIYVQNILGEGEGWEDMVDTARWDSREVRKEVGELSPKRMKLSNE